MTNDALTGATYDVDGGQQLVALSVHRRGVARKNRIPKFPASRPFQDFDLCLDELPARLAPGA
jgi:hypothetical protein